MVLPYIRTCPVFQFVQTVFSKVCQLVLLFIFKLTDGKKGLSFFLNVYTVMSFHICSDSCDRWDRQDGGELRQPEHLSRDPPAAATHTHACTHMHRRTHTQPSLPSGGADLHPKTSFWEGIDLIIPHPAVSPQLQSWDTLILPGPTTDSFWRVVLRGSFHPWISGIFPEHIQVLIICS